MNEPKYRLQSGGEGRASRAFVVLSGRRVYLGPYGSPESLERYRRALEAPTAAGSAAHHRWRGARRRARS